VSEDQSTENRVQKTEDRGQTIIKVSKSQRVKDLCLHVWSWLKGISRDSSRISVLATLGLFVATVCLVIVTAIYANITRNMRDIAKEAFLSDISPKVSLSSPESRVYFSEEKKRLEIIAFFDIRNGGKTEAKDLILKYKIWTRDPADKPKKGEIGPIPYLFPTQQINHPTTVFYKNLTDEALEKVRKIIKGKGILEVEAGDLPNAFLNVELSYVDQENNRKELSYNFRYIPGKDYWVFDVDTDTESKER